MSGPSKSITRRTFLKKTGKILGSTMALGAAFSSGRLLAQSQARNLTALGHSVHRAVLTGTAGGAQIDVITPVLEDLGIESVQWITLDVNPVHERLFREANLPRTSIDFAFSLDHYATARNTQMLEPLGDYMNKSPIEALDDFFPASINAWKRNGEYYAIPFRTNAYLLHYNQEIMGERGISKPPGTIEELFDIAKACTYRKPDGTPVYGFSINGGLGSIDRDVLNLARAWDGDFVTDDGQVVINEPPVVNALTMLREMYEAGILPSNFTQLSANDNIRMHQNGNLVMSINPSTRHALFNDPGVSNVVGQMWFSPPPIAESLRDTYEYSPGRMDVWSIVIPRNSQNKELTWKLLRAVSSPDNHFKMGISGNGSPRASTYESNEYRTNVPYALAELKALENARLNWPAFDNIAEVVDVVSEEFQQAILGFKPVKRALDDAARAVERLV